MRILLTGATGFIGRALVRALLERGHELFCIVRPGIASPADTTGVAADLSTSQPVEFNQPVEAVVHLAQSPHYRHFPAQAPDIVAVNVVTTTSLLELARKLGAQSFVLASSGSVYAGSTSPLTEDADVRPRDFYAASKLAAETLMRPYQTFLRTCALRLFTPYGPGQTGRLVPSLVERVRAGSAITLDGPDGLRLAVTYVDDVAATFTAAIENVDWHGIYNVAAPEPTSLREIGTVIGAILGRRADFIETGKPPPTALIPDLGRLSRQSGVPPFRSLATGLQSTIAAG
jgi:nucleoside-diphosphate-sugar epimerase